MAKKKEETKAEEREDEYDHALAKERNYQSFFCDSSLPVFKGQSCACVQVNKQEKKLTS